MKILFWTKYRKNDNKFSIFTVVGTFLQTTTNAGCCVSKNSFHRRCFCENVVESQICRSLCLCDTGCKGYVMLEDNTSYCQLATNSSCPKDCRGPENNASVQELDPKAECGTIGKWNGGCFIKSSGNSVNVSKQWNISYLNKVCVWSQGIYLIFDFHDSMKKHRTKQHVQQ